VTNKTQSDANFNQSQTEHDNMSDQDASQPPSERVPVTDLELLCRIAYENTAIIYNIHNVECKELQGELAFIRTFCERNGVEL
jgi:hypothetical protein